MSGIFISYRRADSRHPAGRLYGDLADRFGRDQVFRDTDAMEPGVKYAEAIDSFIASCDALVAVIGPKWLEILDEEEKPRLDDPRDVLRREIVSAIEADKVVIPVLVDEAQMPAEVDLPPPLAALASYQALPMSDERWDYDLERLVRSLEKVVSKQLAGGPIPSPAPWVPPVAASTDRWTRPPQPLHVPSAPPPRPTGVPAWVKVVGALSVAVVALVAVVAVVASGGGGNEPGSTVTTLAGTTPLPPTTAAPTTGRTTVRPTIPTPVLPTPTPEVETSITLSPAAGRRGSSVTVSGRGFQAGETVEIRFHVEQVGRATADRNGAFSGVVVRVPTDVPTDFPFEIRATGRQSIRSASEPFDVTG